LPLRAIPQIHHVPSPAMWRVLSQPTEGRRIPANGSCSSPGNFISIAFAGAGLSNSTLLPSGRLVLAHSCGICRAAAPRPGKRRWSIACTVGQVYVTGQPRWTRDAAVKPVFAATPLAI
jgi:hypothetical protein